jgi:hypothetical protein
MVACEVDRAAIQEPCQHQLTQSLDNNAPQRAAVGFAAAHFTHQPSTRIVFPLWRGRKQKQTSRYHSPIQSWENIMQ